MDMRSGIYPFCFSLADGQKTNSLPRYTGKGPDFYLVSNLTLAYAAKACQFCLSFALREIRRK